MIWNQSEELDKLPKATVAYNFALSVVDRFAGTDLSAAPLGWHEFAPHETRIREVKVVRATEKRKREQAATVQRYQILLI